MKLTRRIFVIIFIILVLILTGSVDIRNSVSLDKQLRQEKEQG